MLAAETQTGTRRAEAARAGDGLAMGVAQALALWPGVSRSAMSAVAARYLGFGRSDSMRLARTGLVTTSLAATTLEGISLSRGGVRTDDVPAMAAGAVAALATAVVARPLATHLERSGRLWPWALWRLALAAVAVRRLRIRSFGDDGE